MCICRQIHENLGPRVSRGEGDLDDVQLLLEEGGGEERDFGRILVLKISYVLKACVSGSSAGYVFRHPYRDPDDPSHSHTARDRTSAGAGVGVGVGMGNFEGLQGKGDSSADSTRHAHTAPVSKACSAYSLGGGVGTLRDLDGVRCWLPCLDSPDQRAVFDITIHCPSHLTALTCGKKILSRVSSTPPSEKRDRDRERERERGRRRRGSVDGSDPSLLSLPLQALSTMSPLEYSFSSDPTALPSDADDRSVRSGIIQRRGGRGR